MTVDINFTNGKLTRATRFVRQILKEQYGGNIQGKDMVVTVTTIEHNYGSSEIYGYEMTKSGTYSLGQVIRNGDGSTTRIAVIL